MQEAETDSCRETKVYAAPMEGLTDDTFRRVHHALFPGVDKYFIPFIKSHATGHFQKREIRDLLPENNVGIPVVPQILAGDAAAFVETARRVMAFGYREIDLNLGCPSGTVTAKGRGAGMLRDVEGLRRFLDEVFLVLPPEEVRLSAKTRLGWQSEEEFPALWACLCAFPFSEVLVHARVREDFYRGMPRRKALEEQLPTAPWPVGYNGDLWTREDADRVEEELPAVNSLMVGRGLMANPALAREIAGGEKLTAVEAKTFHDQLLAAYGARLQEEPLLFRMKEQWYYLERLFPGREREVRAIKKAKTLGEYRAAANSLFGGASKERADSTWDTKIT